MAPILAHLFLISFFEAYDYGDDTNHLATCPTCPGAQARRPRSDEPGGRARPATPGHVGEGGPGDSGSVGAGRDLLLRAAGTGGDGAFIALSERRRHLRLDETRAGGRAWVPLWLVLLDQQRPLLSEPADIGGGGRHLCHRRGGFEAGRKFNLRYHHDARNALDRDGGQYCRRRYRQMASEPRRNRHVHSGNNNYPCGCLRVAESTRSELDHGWRSHAPKNRL